MTSREALLSMARAARARLDHAIDLLTGEDAVSTALAARCGNPEPADPASVGPLIRDVHAAVFPKSLRWLVFAEALEAGAHDPMRASALVAARVMRSYAETFPDVTLDVERVTAAVEAWRTDRDHWKAIHHALVGALPSVPSPRSMATKWSAMQKRQRWAAPSGLRSRRRPKVATKN